MPSNKKVTGPDGTWIEFDEAAHRYFTDYGNGDFVVDYTSVTTLINQYFKPFDSAFHAARVAAREGIAPEAVLAKWKAKAVYSTTVGTRVHEVCEDVLRGKAIRNTPNDEHERKLMKQGWTAATEVKKKMKIFDIESIIFDVRIRVAGTADFLAYDQSGVLWVLDWKTNETFDMESQYGQYGLGPLSHLQDCDAVHYGLQLSFYDYLLKKKGYIDKKTQIRRAAIHIMEDEFKTIPLPSYAVEVRDIVIANCLDEDPFASSGKEFSIR